MFVAVLRLLCRACGDRDTRPGGLRRQALWAMLLLLRELLSLSDQSVSRGVISTAADAICAAWCDLYQKFSNRWKLDAVVFLYLAARGLKQGWLPKSAYETALNTLHTAVMNPDRCVRLRALRCLRRLQDRGSLEDLYRSMAEYQDTAAVFIRAISSFAT